MDKCNVFCVDMHKISGELGDDGHKLVRLWHVCGRLAPLDSEYLFEELYLGDSIGGSREDVYGAIPFVL